MLMAELHIAAEDFPEAKRALGDLANAERPQWVCDNCQQVHGNWEPVCSNCKSFDTLSWRAPPESEAATAPGVEILPLIVGAIEDKTADEEVVEADHEVIVVEPSETSEDSPKEEAKS